VEGSTPSWRALETEPVPGPDTPATTTTSLRSWVPLACFATAAVLAVAAFLVAASGAGVVAVDGATVVGDGGSPGPSSIEPVAGGALVEVSGAVVHPGVYRLPAGARVVDAVSAAGGFGPRVDTVRADRELNLAAPVVDGAEIRVPSRDDVAAAAPSGTGSPVASGGLVDLNRASETELDALPGVGPATVAKIVAARPFASIDELKSKGVVGEKTLEKLRPLVTVGP
jgi:competence protein ComEA